MGAEMRIIECPECKGKGSFNVFKTYIKCLNCHGHGEMNIREWLFWKYVFIGLGGDPRWIKLGNLLWELKEIGERKVKKE